MHDVCDRSSNNTATLRAVCDSWTFHTSAARTPQRGGTTGEIRLQCNYTQLRAVMSVLSCDVSFERLSMRAIQVGMEEIQSLHQEIHCNQQHYTSLWLQSPWLLEVTHKYHLVMTSLSW